MEEERKDEKESSKDGKKRDERQEKMGWGRKRGRFGRRRKK